AQQPAPTPPPLQSKKGDDLGDAVVEDEDDEEFEMIRDEEETFDKSRLGDSNKKEDLKITKIPLHLRANWESYFIEFVMILGLLLYFINFILGRTKNFSIANSWYEKNLELLENNFSLVGDDGKKEIEYHGLMKETESVYTLWCSGRNAVDGMLAEIHLIKRHDLLSVVINYFKPTNDKIIIKTSLNPDVLDNFVFCIANRKSAVRLSKEMNDIATFCPERKSPDKYGVTSQDFVLLNEIGEAASFILDSKVAALLNKNESLIDYIHVSDQYSGLRITDDSQNATKLPEVKKMLIASFIFPSNAQNPEEIERMNHLLQLVFYLIDKLKRFRLSRESKVKSDRNRQKVQKLYLASTHLQRQEMAQQKREEKRRMEKEKILAETDPDKQRRWEEKEYKREMKRKVPKMKQLKVKAM
ncbi:Coiled-coil domain-containing protein 47, partial [Tyrophagus putrescentiae]